MLYYLHQLVTGYGSDPRITHLLDTRTVYLCPRLNPDGAELALGRQAAPHPLVDAALSVRRGRRSTA